MATIHNSQLSKELREGAKIQISKDAIPNQLADKVVPTMETNPKLLRRIDIVRDLANSSTGGTVYTTPATQDFYLCGIFLSYTCDAAADSTYYRVQCYVGGVQRNIISLRKTTLTAGTDAIFVPFPIPVKIDRNTVINSSNVLTVGTNYTQCTIFGYVDEQSNA